MEANPLILSAASTFCRGFAFMSYTVTKILLVVSFSSFTVTPPSLIAALLASDITQKPMSTDWKDFMIRSSATPR
jgi:hypothetical protein